MDIPDNKLPMIRARGSLANPMKRHCEEFGYEPSTKRNIPLVLFMDVSSLSTTLNFLIICLNNLNYVIFVYWRPGRPSLWPRCKITLRGIHGRA